MIETDAPFLLPRTHLPAPPKGYDGRRNEPAFLPAVVTGIARATGRDELEIATETTRTARQFFALAATARSSSSRPSRPGPRPP